MAIRIDASGDFLWRTANLPPLNAYTACLWLYYIAPPANNQFATIIGATNDGGSPAYHLLGVFNNGGTPLFVIGTNNGTTSDDAAFGSMLMQNTWNFVALRSNGANVTAFHRTLPGAWQTAQVGYFTFSQTHLSFGSDPFDEWINGRLAGMKSWDDALTDAEIEREALTFLPQRTADLNLWAPGFAGAGERGRDYGPNGRNLTEGGTLTDEDMPPLGWGGRPYVIVPGGVPTPPVEGQPARLAQAVLGRQLIR